MSIMYILNGLADTIDGSWALHRRFVAEYLAFLRGRRGLFGIKVTTADNCLLLLTDTGKLFVSLWWEVLDRL